MTSLGSVFRTMYVVSEQWQEDIGLSFYEHLHFPVSLCVNSHCALVCFWCDSNDTEGPRGAVTSLCGHPPNVKHH